MPSYTHKLLLYRGVCLSHRLPAPLAGERGSHTPLLAEDDGSLTLVGDGFHDPCLVRRPDSSSALRPPL